MTTINAPADLIAEGRAAYIEYGEVWGPWQNPYIVGPGREHQAQLWWRGFNEERSERRNLSAKEQGR